MVDILNRPRTKYMITTELNVTKNYNGYHPSYLILRYYNNWRKGGRELMMNSLYATNYFTLGIRSYFLVAMLRLPF